MLCRYKAGKLQRRRSSLSTLYPRSEVRVTTPYLALILGGSGAAVHSRIGSSRDEKAQGRVALSM